ncbi:MAG: 2-enoyl thioester reductase domain-containing protein [Proteobacteria bacterium]|nr:2-enoyl thioester reductase domain-containing protein [Pseudomonadota bacterium]
MKIAELTAIGPAEQVVHCVEVPDIGAPGPGEVAVDMLACPINPADILQIEGGYATRPVTPCRIGAEGVGRVRALGRAVSGIGVGDLVINLARDNWVAAQILPASGVIKLPAGIDVQQAAMLKVNAGTAACMLSDFVDLSPGDWVIQNAANSGVGADVIRLARRAGYRTVNIVRRDSAVEPLRALGGDVVLVDGPDLPARVAIAIRDAAGETRGDTGRDTGGAAPRLALDAVAGSGVVQLADCLADGGVVVNYGLLSGEPCQITADQLIFRDIKLVGFWRGKSLQTQTYAEISALYDDLAKCTLDGTLAVEVEATYPLSRISEALAHAKREGRNGKVLLLPNEGSS